MSSTQFHTDGATVTSIALARTSVSFTPDTIQEFMVQQSNYSAQYAQAGGRFNFNRDQTADRFCSATPYSGNISGCAGTAQAGSELGYSRPVLQGDPTLFIVPASSDIRLSDESTVVDVNGNVRQDVRCWALVFVGDPSFRTPVIQMYNLTVQYQFMADTVFSAGYRRSRGSTYHALVTEVERRFLQGLQFRFN